MNGAIETGHRESEEADELGGGGELDRIEAISVPVQIGDDPVHQCIALRAGKARREMAHDARVAIHAEKRLAVGVPQPRNSSRVVSRYKGPIVLRS